MNNAGKKSWKKPAAGAFALVLIVGACLFFGGSGEALRAQDLKREGKTEAIEFVTGNYKTYLSSLEDVENILKGAIAKYDTDGLFRVDIDEEELKKKGPTSPIIVKNDGSANMIKYVSMYGEGVGTGFYPSKGIPSGLVGMAFEKEITIKKRVVAEDKLKDWESVLSDITKDKEKNQVYTVVAGDCLGVVAEKLDMKLDRLLELNNFEDEGEILHVGDELVVSVPEPDLSILSNVVSTSEEEYKADTEYKLNDSWYTTQSVTLSEGTIGRRVATTSTVSRNGRESTKSLIASVILEESVPDVVEKGTQEPPTYIKPIRGGRFSSGFAMRWGKMHKGVDWACGTGTPVFASCGGTVVRADYSGSYGYVVYINHPDGRQTRYAHNSKLACHVGQQVKQGEVIAYSGSTGNSTGPHVHFEILIGGTQVNPLKYLQ